METDEAMKILRTKVLCVVIVVALLSIICAGVIMLFPERSCRIDWYGTKPAVVIDEIEYAVSGRAVGGIPPYYRTSPFQFYFFASAPSERLPIKILPISVSFIDSNLRNTVLVENNTQAVSLVARGEKGSAHIGIGETLILDSSSHADVSVAVIWRTEFCGGANCYSNTFQVHRGTYSWSGRVFRPWAAYEDSRQRKNWMEKAGYWGNRTHIKK